MKISVELFRKATGASAAIHAVWAQPLESAMDRYKIQKPTNVAAFLANLGVECAGFTRFTEGLNYGAQGLADTWPNRYAVDPKARPRVPNATAKRIERDPVAIANLTYANRMGNGDEKSGDGWRFRGRGPIQLTGKDMYLQFQKDSGIAVMTDQQIITQPNEGSISAAWFWDMKGCSRAGNEGDINRTVLLVNGALPGASNHGDLRLKNYEEALFQALADFG